MSSNNQVELFIFVSFGLGFKAIYLERMFRFSVRISYSVGQFHVKFSYNQIIQFHCILYFLGIQFVFELVRWSVLVLKWKLKSVEFHISKTRSARRIGDIYFSISVSAHGLTIYTLISHKFQREKTPNSHIWRAKERPKSLKLKSPHSLYLFPLKLPYSMRGD